MAKTPKRARCIALEETPRAFGFQALLLALFASVCGCPSGAHDAASPAPSVPHVLCAAFEADQRPYLERLQSVMRDGSHALDPLGRCWPTSRGAWALSIDEKPTADSRYARWSLVHIDASGARSAVGPSLGFDAKKNLDVVGTTIDRPAFFDFDGDGEVEMFLRVGWSPNGFERAAAGRIWTARAEKGIERYAPAADLDVELLRDVDGDGRPDAITYSPYVTPNPYKNTCEPTSVRLHGPPFVAHALADGTFRRDDAMARAEAHRVCTAMPPSLVVTVDDVIDVQETTRNVACARLLGRSADDVAASLLARCGAATCDVSACSEIDEWLRFARFEPPPG